MASSGEALQQLQAAQSQNNPQANLQDAATRYDLTGAAQQVGGLRQAINQTTGLLSQVAPGVMGRIGNSLVGNAQANAQIQKESAPVQAQLDSDTAAYNDASSNYDKLASSSADWADTSNTASQTRLNYLQKIYQDYLQKESDDANFNVAWGASNDKLAKSRL